MTFLAKIVGILLFIAGLAAVPQHGADRDQSYLLAQDVTKQPQALGASDKVPLDLAGEASPAEEPVAVPQSEPSQPGSKLPSKATGKPAVLEKREVTSEPKQPHFAQEVQPGQALPKPSTDWAKSVTQGKTLAVKGDLTRANKYFNKAFKLARTPVLKAQTNVMWANSLSKATRLGEHKDSLLSLEQAVKLYRSALPHLSGNDRLFAHNNYGSLLLRQGRSQEALKILQEVEDEYSKMEDTELRARYLYNLARAFEMNGNFKDALKQYQEAATAQFKPANHAVFRLLLQQPLQPSLTREMTNWLNVTLEQRHMDLVERYLRAVLNKPQWVSQSGFNSILVSLVRYLTAVEISVESFQAKWEKYLMDVPGARQQTQGIVKEIFATYYGNFPIKFQPESGKNHFRNFLYRADKERSAILSKFLKMAGDGYLREQVIDRALQRYALAWTIDTSNVDAALFAANVLLEKSQVIDPHGKLIQEFIFHLFESKAGAYLGEDWANIFRFHTVLGAIYEKQHQWGPSWNPRSAIFQWEHALQAHDRLVFQDPEPTMPVPRLRERLGMAYEAAGKEQDAFASYLTGVQEAVRIDDIDLAEVALTKAEHLSRHLTLNIVQQQRLKHLRKLVEQL